MRNRQVPRLATVLPLALVLAAGVFPSPLPSQDAPAGPPAAQSVLPLQASEIDSLLARIKTRFQVYPLRDGLMLLPKYQAPSVQSVQVSGGTVGINGRTATGSEIASLLDEDAAPVLRLSYLPPEQLLERFQAQAAPADTGFGPGAAPVGSIADADTAAGVPETGPEDDTGRPEAAVDDEGADMDDDEEGDDGEWDRDPDFFSTEDGGQVRMGSDITVREGQVVEGDVVSIGGDVDIAGLVEGDAVSIGGVLRLRDTARIDGDAVSVGGRMEKSAGARVRGETTIVGMSFPFTHSRDFTWDGGGMFDAVGGLMFTLLWIGLLLLLGAIFVLFLRRPVDRVETNLRSSPLKAGIVGFLAQVLFLPVFVITFVFLCITIIGIPLAIIWLLVIPLVGFLAAFFGFTATAKATGHAVADRRGAPLHSPYVAVFLGLVILHLPFLLSRLFDFGGGVADVFSGIFMALGSLVLYLAFTIGFGAVVLTRFGTRTTWSGEPPGELGAPAVPPTSPPAPAPAPEPGGEPAYRSLSETPAGRLASGRAGMREEPYGGSQGNEVSPVV